MKDQIKQLVSEAIEPPFGSGETPLHPLVKESMIERIASAIVRLPCMQSVPPEARAVEAAEEICPTPKGTPPNEICFDVERKRIAAIIQRVCFPPEKPTFAERVEKNGVELFGYKPGWSGEGKDWAKKAAQALIAIDGPCITSYQCAGVGHGAVEQIAGVILKHAPSRPTAARECGASEAEEPDNIEDLITAIQKSIDAVNNPPYFDKLPKWPEARNELVHRIRKDIAANRLRMIEDAEWEKRTRWLMERATYNGGGHGGRFEITFMTPLDSEDEIAQLDAARTPQPPSP